MRRIINDAVSFVVKARCGVGRQKLGPELEQPLR
jgi:hypothetical protein